MKRAPLFLWLLLLGMGTAQCGGPDRYVWYRDLPSTTAAAEDEYVMRAGDLVNVRVFGQEEMSTRAHVRRDGRMSVPFLGDLELAGKRPAVVAKEIEERLRAFVNAPKVTVVVEEFQPMTVSVVGEVSHPGTFPIETDTGILQALANAGGPTEYADKDRIFVLRKGRVLRRIRFTYDSLIRNDPQAAAFTLRTGDVVVVE